MGELPFGASATIVMRANGAGMTRAILPGLEAELTTDDRVRVALLSCE